MALRSSGSNLGFSKMKSREGNTFFTKIVLNAAPMPNLILSTTAGQYSYVNCKYYEETKMRVTAVTPKLLQLTFLLTLIRKSKSVVVIARCGFRL